MKVAAPACKLHQRDGINSRWWFLGRLRPQSAFEAVQLRLTTNPPRQCSFSELCQQPVEFTEEGCPRFVKPRVRNYSPPISALTSVSTFQCAAASERWVRSHLLSASVSAS